MADAMSIATNMASEIAPGVEFTDEQKGAWAMMIAMGDYKAVSTAISEAIRAMKESENNAARLR